MTTETTIPPDTTTTTPPPCAGICGPARVEQPAVRVTLPPIPDSTISAAPLPPTTVAVVEVAPAPPPQTLPATGVSSWAAAGLALACLLAGARLVRTARRDGYRLESDAAGGDTDG